MFVTNWISTTKIQKISEITNFFRHYFLSRTEVKNAQKLASFEKYTYICNMKNLLAGDMIKTIRTEWR